VLSGGRGRVSINLMQSSLRARFPGPVNFSIVDLENPRFDQPDYQEHFAAALRSGYAGEKLDLIVAVMTPSRVCRSIWQQGISRRPHRLHVD